MALTLCEPLWPVLGEEGGARGPRLRTAPNPPGSVGFKETGQEWVRGVGGGFGHSDPHQRVSFPVLRDGVFLVSWGGNPDRAHLTGSVWGPCDG